MNGRQKLLTIGRHGSPWTPETARKEARCLLVLLEQGIDPLEEKRRERAKKSLAQLAQRFDEEHIQQLKERSQEEYRRLFRLHIIPHLGRKSLADITRDDIASLHRKMKDTPRAANFCLAVLSKFMNWAEEKGLRPQFSNPVRGIRKYPENHRERFLTAEELQRLGQALDEELREHGDIYGVAAIRLLILTGARLNEILTLKWEYVDLERGLLLLPDSKTGKKAIVLNAAAREVLEQLPRLHGNPHIICGHKEGSHLVNLQKPWRRIRKRAGIEDVRIHDCATPLPRWRRARAVPCHASARCSATARCRPPSAMPTSSLMTCASSPKPSATNWPTWCLVRTGHNRPENPVPDSIISSVHARHEHARRSNSRRITPAPSFPLQSQELTGKSLHMAIFNMCRQNRRADKGLR